MNSTGLVDRGLVVGVNIPGICIVCLLLRNIDFFAKLFVSMSEL